MNEDPTLPLGVYQASRSEAPPASATWGSFTLLARVGFGGFGEVYRAVSYTHLSALEVPNTYCLIIATGQCHIARWREAKLIYTALVSDELNGSLSRSRVYEMNDVIALGTKDALRISRQRRFAVMTANRCNHLKMGEDVYKRQSVNRAF